MTRIPSHSPHKIWQPARVPKGVCPKTKRPSPSTGCTFDYPNDDWVPKDGVITIRKKPEKKPFKPFVIFSGEGGI